MNGKVKWFNNGSDLITTYLVYHTSAGNSILFLSKIKRWIAPPLLRTLMITYILFIF